MSGQTQKKILIITQEIDPHADVMVVELRRRGADFIRWHADSFPLHSSVTLRLERESIEGSIRLNGEAIDLRSIRSVWYRRPTPFLLPPTLSEDEREFARGELRSAFHGLFRIADWFWVNHPDKIRVASSKALQLAFFWRVR
ncbi:MAG: hypothetical protein HYT78_08270 [Deltaproteobacteria bacterium]|nr:hypothetical protein [Deltaproteobacteria bacterium]